VLSSEKIAQRQSIRVQKRCSWAHFGLCFSARNGFIVPVRLNKRHKARFLPLQVPSYGVGMKLLARFLRVRINSREFLFTCRIKALSALLVSLGFRPGRFEPISIRSWCFSRSFIVRYTVVRGRSRAVAT
jgi:hypothetical protein